MGGGMFVMLFTKRRGSSRLSNLPLKGLGARGALPGPFLLPSPVLALSDPYADDLHADTSIWLVGDRGLEPLTFRV